MKKLLCIALVLCLVLLWGCEAVDEPTEQEYVPEVEHLLWDVPFGIGEEECVALMKERAGIELSVKEYGSRNVLEGLFKVVFEGRYPLFNFLRSATDCSTILGESTKVEAYFVEDKTFQSMRLWQTVTHGNVWRDVLEEETMWRLKYALNVFEEVKAQYGDMTRGYVHVYDANTKGKRQEDVYTYPVTDDGMPDVDTLFRILLENDEVTLRIYHDNIRVNAIFDRTDGIYDDMDYNYSYFLYMSLDTGSISFLNTVQKQWLSVPEQVSDYPR